MLFENDRENMSLIIFFIVIGFVIFIFSTFSVEPPPINQW